MPIFEKAFPSSKRLPEYNSSSNSISEGHKKPLIRKRDRAVLEGPEDPDVPAVPVGPGPLYNWGGRKMPFFERVSLPSTAFTVPLTTRNVVTALRPSRAVVQSPPAMIVGNYKNLILTIKLVKNVLGTMQGDQPEMADSCRRIVRAICRLGDFFCIAISQHRSRYGLHLPVSASQAQRSHYQTLVAIRSVSELNDSCDEFVPTFTKYLKKAGVEEAEVQRVVGLAPVNPADVGESSVNMSLGNQNQN
ncbi:hypothetical protein HG530_002038 [Fusarium avenaceum]|nr:hypothetical protein HG530_002038 [Fusarium avenaceum]